MNRYALCEGAQLPPGGYPGSEAYGEHSPCPPATAGTTEEGGAQSQRGPIPEASPRIRHRCSNIRSREWQLHGFHARFTREGSNGQTLGGESLGTLR